MRQPNRPTTMRREEVPGDVRDRASLRDAVKDGRSRGLAALVARHGVPGDAQPGTEGSLRQPEAPPHGGDAVGQPVGLGGEGAALLHRGSAAKARAVSAETLVCSHCRV